jgi:DNA polymerase I-like protein with 3'-5' exonuclease and polymerase domains
MTLRTWDIETTIGTAFKRKGTPFGGLNWCVTHGWKEAGQPVTEHRFGSHPPGPGWLKPVLDGCTLLGGFNIKFDLLHALQDAENLDAWMEWIVAGGQIWDAQLAEYLLEGMDQKNHMLSLDEVAPRYGGSTKFDEIKLLWEAGVNTHEIEPALLTRYLCGDPSRGEMGDVENTELIVQGQIKRARECGQLRSILLNMGALICSIEMERNGMYVDKARGLVMAEELKVKIVELDKLLAEYIPKDLPFAFNWGSPKQKSALIFGGTVQWDAYEYDCVPCTQFGWETILRHDYEAMPEAQRPARVYAQMDQVRWCLKDGSTTATDPFDSSDLTQYVTYTSGKNTGDFKTKKVKIDNLDRPKGRSVKAPYTFKGFTTPSKKWQGSEPGFYSTGADVIEELGTRNIPFLKTLSTFQKLTKDLGTYFISDGADGEPKGMLTLVGLDGLIHHKINHTSTVTGRFSESDPNLQNVPQGNKSQVKLLFVSRWGADGVIIQSDFSSLEIYVQAILTHCDQLIADLKAGLDMHVKRLALKEGKTYDETFVLCKGDKANGIEADKDWDYKRTGAKVFSFQRAYGAGAAKIADSTGMPIDDVKALIVAEELEYPEIGEHFVKRTEEIKMNRRPSGYAIPHPEFPSIMCNLGKAYIRTPDGKLYSYQESPSPEYLVKRGTFASFSPTEIKNYEVQGTGGEWMKAAMWLMVRAWYARKNFGGLSLLVNTVHDAAYSDSHNSVKLEAAALMHACMEAASDLMEYWFAWTLPLPVPSDTSWGPSMMDEDKIPGLNELAAPLRKQLRDQYMAGYTPSYLH